MGEEKREREGTLTGGRKEGRKNPANCSYSGKKERE